MLANVMDPPETTFDMIHEYVLENLRRRTTGRSYETHRLGDKTIFETSSITIAEDGEAVTKWSQLGENYNILQN